jgi:hypothetical protein
MLTNPLAEQTSVHVFLPGMEPESPQRWARVRPQLAWKRPGLPREWVRVLEHYQAGGLRADPGYVWLETWAKVLHVMERDLEFTNEPAVD